MLKGVATRPVVGISALALALVVLCALGGGSAAAKAPIYSFRSEPESTRAGSHPDIVSEFKLGTRYNQGYSKCACNDPKEVVIHAPPGVIANPHVLSICTAAQAATYTCSANAQAGFVIVRDIVGIFNVIPLYRTVPQAGQAALFEFAPPEIGQANSQYISINARTGSDYGLDFRSEDIEHIAPPEYVAQVFWGLPASPGHEFLRFGPNEVQLFCAANPLDELLEDHVPAQCEELASAGGSTSLTEAPKGRVASSLPLKPFTELPTSCVGPLRATIETLAYDNETDQAEAQWPGTTGCDQLSFSPSLSANPTTAETDTAAGLDVKLTVPQYQDPETPSPSEIRATTMTLPPGFSINPNAANGKTSCSDVQAGFGTIEPAQCPEFAKVGTDELESSALPGPIPGAIYLGEPKPGDRYRMILTAGGFGTFVKIAGSVHADPQTGQLVVSFQDLPQAPFQEFDLHFFGSERGLLATPTQCGAYSVHTTFTPWDAEISEQSSTQFFVLDSGPGGSPCPGPLRPLQPGFEAGSANNTGGAHSEFNLNLTRRDGDQNLVGISVVTPPGFVATLKGVPYCPQSALDQLASPGYSGLAELAAPSCPAASQIGTSVTGAGAGTRPLYVSGRVYLAGPYKGEPLSIAVATPAVSGPYDLGNVVVRAALHVDPVTAQVTTISDPLPQILEGIPLRLRSLHVRLDRPDFVLNPTNCDPFSVDATVAGDQGGSAKLSAPFQVANCADLGFAPKLSLTLTGGLRRLGHPAIHAVLGTRQGDANGRRISVSLPDGELLDNSHIGTVCTRVEFSNHACPSAAQLGRAEVSSPLLDRPLTGTVYLRSSSHALPDLALQLSGQFDVEAVAHIDSRNGHFGATFDEIPDVPLGIVRLDLFGGARGLLQNSKSLCGARKHATVRMTGQNGRLRRTKVKLGLRCGSNARPKRHRHRQHRIHTRKAVR
jgi:hypothetical protein